MAQAIAAVPVGGTWWRQVPHGRDPLGRPDPPRDARWQRGAVVDGLYLADSPDTAWAEWYRWLAESALPPAAGLPRDLWRFEVALEGVADLRSAEALAELGLSLPRPDRREWPRFQAVGERLAAEGHPALVAPSAARPDGQVMCCFWPAANDSVISAVGRPVVVREVPPPPRGMQT